MYLATGKYEIYASKSNENLNKNSIPFYKHSIFNNDKITLITIMPLKLFYYVIIFQNVYLNKIYNF